MTSYREKCVRCRLYGRYLTNDVLAQLTQSQAEVDTVITTTKRALQQHLYTAQELCLLRDSLADELSCLSQQLVSSLSGPEGQPTLLEDIETLHRNMKELQSVKEYVRIVEHGLGIRYARKHG